MKEEDDEIYYSWHAVAFLDVLGQKDAVSRFKGVPKDTNDPEFVSVIQQTANFIRALRSGFATIFSGYSRSTIKREDIPEAYRDEFFATRAVDLKYYGMSDSFVAWTTLKTETNHCRALNGIYGMLFAAAGMMVYSFACKHSVRGAIEVDGAMRLHKGSDEIYGPALSCAYVLESKKAKWPRILLGEGLISYLDTMSKTTGVDIPSQHSRNIAKSCLSFAMRDVDGQMALDYLNPEVLKIAPKAYDKAAVLDPARKHVQEQYAYFSGKSCPHPKREELRERYEQVLSYFNARLPGK